MEILRYRTHRDKYLPLVSSKIFQNPVCGHELQPFSDWQLTVSLTNNAFPLILNIFGSHFQDTLEIGFLHPKVASFILEKNSQAKPCQFFGTYKDLS